MIRIAINVVSQHLLRTLGKLQTTMVSHLYVLATVIDGMRMLSYFAHE